jgi:hypothetical protein
MFGNKSKTIAELEAEITSLKSITDVDRDNLRKLREILKITTTDNVNDAVQRIIDNDAELVTENDNLSADLRQVQSELEAVKLRASKPSKQHRKKA